MEEKQEDDMSNGTVMEEITEKEQSEAIIVGSEEMELDISHILEKIERFTQLVTIILHKLLVIYNNFNYLISFLIISWRSRSC